jgi:glycosyltransferase involved in cell wall biosynthesis
MRIALVMAGPYPALRGSQVLVRHLAEGLEARGHAVSVVSFGRRLATRPEPCVARVALDVALVARLWRVVRREGSEVVHAHNYEAAIAGLVVARLTGLPLVYHGHTALAHELPLYADGERVRAWLGRLGRFLDAQVPRRADFCIAVTDELGETLRQAGVVADELACIAPTSVPADLGRPPPPAAEVPLVCYAGNLDGYQNLAFLLRSFACVRAAVPHARLVLVTHGDAHQRVRRQLGRDGLGHGVEIVRAQSYDDVRRRLDASAVAVCPRTERSGFPMKLLNYMAAGKAIVASAGSAKGLSHGVTGLVVPDDDPAAFAGAVTALLEDASLRLRLGTAARRAVERSDAWEGVLDRIETIYRRVLARARPALVPVAAAE